MKQNFLNEILDHKRALAESQRDFYRQLKAEAKSVDAVKAGGFKRAVSQPGLNVIMELKKASPSQGIICPDFNLSAIAEIYAENGAAAFSVLTEEKFFLGRPEYIRELSRAFDIPILIKDFIIDEGQIYEARANGAAAVLLIVRILEDQSLKHLMAVAKNLAMDVLVEVHDNNELDRALNAGAEIIGVNNRNLDTFVVDMKTSDELIPRIVKAGKIAVAESGIKTHKDVQHLKSLGARAVLIGETFMAAPDIGKKIREVMGKD
jgi:indole-3-glycerol phosphate synthase